MAIKPALKLIGYILAIAAICVVVWQISAAVRSHQIAANRTTSKNNIKQIMLAMHQYYDDNDRFPPAFVVGPDGERWHSWRALILPYIEPQLASEYRFDEPWNGSQNAKLLDRAPAVFQSDSVSPPANATSYFAVVGKRTLWPADQSLRFRDIPDGTSNTLAVVESEQTDIQWLEPRDLLMHEFFGSFYEGKLSREVGGCNVGLVDGSARFLMAKLDRDILMGLLTPSYQSDTYKGDNWPTDLVGPSPVQKFRERISVESLQGTELLAAASEQMDTASNQLWAASFQMVWDKLKAEVDGPVVLGKSTPTLDQLNSSSFDRNSLSKDASFTATVMVGPQQDANLLAAVKQKFPDVEPQLQDIPLEPGQWGLRLYAMIRKSMPFEAIFHRFQVPLQFSDGKQTAPVNSFGQDPRQHDSVESPFPVDQVTVLDDWGDDDFIVQLSTTGPQRDQIILALVPSGSTLQETWETVQQRIEKPNPRHHRPALGGNETLQIPIIDFSLQKHFSQLENQPIAGFDEPAILELAFLDIRLRLDETGAEFLSVAEAGVIGEFGEAEEPKPYEPERIRQLVFKRSFFVAMREQGATQPWFMAWIANDELMESFIAMQN